MLESPLVLEGLAYPTSEVMNFFIASLALREASVSAQHAYQWLAKLENAPKWSGRRAEFVALKCKDAKKAANRDASPRGGRGRGGTMFYVLQVKARRPVARPPLSHTAGSTQRNAAVRGVPLRPPPPAPHPFMTCPPRPRATGAAVCARQRDGAPPARHGRRGAGGPLVAPGRQPPGAPTPPPRAVLRSVRARGRVAVGRGVLASEPAAPCPAARWRCLVLSDAHRLRRRGTA